MENELDEAIKRLESPKKSDLEEIIKLLKKHELLFEDQSRVLRRYRELYNPDLVEGTNES